MRCQTKNKSDTERQLLYKRRVRSHNAGVLLKTAVTGTCSGLNGPVSSSSKDSLPTQTYSHSVTFFGDNSTGCLQQNREVKGQMDFVAKYDVIGRK